MKDLALHFNGKIPILIKSNPISKPKTEEFFEALHYKPYVKYIKEQKGILSSISYFDEQNCYSVCTFCVNISGILTLFKKRKKADLK